MSNGSKDIAASGLPIHADNVSNVYGRESLDPSGRLFPSHCYDAHVLSEMYYVMLFMISD